LQLLIEPSEIEIAWWLSLELLESWNRPGGGDSRLCGRVLGRCGLNRIASVGQEEDCASIRAMERIGMKYEREIVHRNFPAVLYSIENKAS